MQKKILLIEDDHILRENTSEILQLANYDVITAENGKEGVDKAISSIPDLIICDILMPELDGYGVLQIILRNKRLQKTPFIFMTAKTKHSDMRRGMDLGASDYITKPFEESELLSSIESRLKISEVFKKEASSDYSYLEESITFEKLEEVFSFKEQFTYKKGMTIYCEGNSSNYIFYIVKGEIKTYKDNEEGKELITGIYKNHSFFGFTPLIRNKPYGENAIAIKKTRLLKITKREVLVLIKNNPQLAIHFLDLLSENLEDTKNHLIQIAYDSVRKKTADSLIQLSLQNDNTQTIEISRSNLASLIGIAKETLTRTLTDLKEEKIIDTNRNSIRIIDLKKLRSIN